MKISLGRKVKVVFGEIPSETKIYVDGVLVKGATFVGVFVDVDSLAPELVLEFWVEGLRSGSIKMPVTGVFEGELIGG